MNLSNVNLRVLKSVAEPIDLDKDNLSMLITSLENELKAPGIRGVGLAAPQIGISKRVAIVRHRDTKFDMWNPVLVSKEDPIVSSEGCLSFPGVIRSVRRFQEVALKNGDGRTYSFSGFEAVIVQHEFEHLDGVTIVDKEVRTMKVGRNEKCPCGSGRKFKKCHVDREAELEALLIEGVH